MLKEKILLSLLSQGSEKLRWRDRGLRAQAHSMCSRALRQMWVRPLPLVPLVCQAQCTGEGVQDFSKRQVQISTPGRLLLTQPPPWARW